MKKHNGNLPPQLKTYWREPKSLADIRQFFTERGLLEVETPVLSEFGVTGSSPFKLLVQNLSRLLMSCRKRCGFLPARNIT